MQSTSPFLAVPEPVLQTRGGDLWDLAEVCLQRTAGALHEARAATPAEVSQAISIARESHVEERPMDMLEVMARVQGHGEEHLSAAILDLGNKVAATLTPYAPLIPFAGKLIAPSAF